MIEPRGYKGLGTSLPFYVTRKTGDDLIMTYSASAWMTFLVMLLGWANVVGWGIYGLIVLATKAV